MNPCPLQKSRSSKGVKEPADINALADEYLRLSYHGFRTKDKSFNAAFNTDFDNSIADIPIIRQDIGRVLLNLYNNAFYAVSEKKRQIGEGYDPTLSVSTLKENGRVVIKVNDNGSCKIKSSCRFLPPNQQDKERDWVSRWLMT
jgi:nitrogen fixation/metabolism regulation signal transduction histidine kinase